MAFRKRFSEEDIAAILEASIPQPEKAEEEGNDGDEGEPPNSGTLVLDATCCPADIAYPQDVNLLNQAREKLEKTVDEICENTGENKPRMYRRRARRDFLRLSKSKKRSAKAIRSAIRKQLQYIRRDVGYIVRFVQNGVKLTEKQKNRLNLVTTVYEQQRMEGLFGTGKTAYGLGRISVRLEESSCCVIGVALLLWNLTKGLRSLWRAFLRFLFSLPICGVAE